MSPHRLVPAIDAQVEWRRAILEAAVYGPSRYRPSAWEPAPVPAPPVLGPLERLLLEELPTGQVRDWDSRRPAVSEKEAAQHRQVLEAAVYRTTTRKRAA